MQLGKAPIREKLCFTGIVLTILDAYQVDGLRSSDNRHPSPRLKVLQRIPGQLFQGTILDAQQPDALFCNTRARVESTLGFVRLIACRDPIRVSTRCND